MSWWRSCFHNRCLFNSTQQNSKLFLHPTAKRQTETQRQRYRQRGRNTEADRQRYRQRGRLMCEVRTSDMTIFSLNGSIGGLVTWANSCLKYSNTRGLYCDRQASGVSLPIDPNASFLHRYTHHSHMSSSYMTVPTHTWPHPQCGLYCDRQASGVSLPINPNASFLHRYIDIPNMYKVLLLRNLVWTIACFFLRWQTMTRWLWAGMVEQVCFRRPSICPSTCLSQVVRFTHLL